MTLRVLASIQVVYFGNEPSSRFGDLLQKLKHLEDTSEVQSRESFPDESPPWQNPKSVFPFSKHSGPIPKSKASKFSSQTQTTTDYSKNILSGRRGPPPGRYMPKHPEFKTRPPPPPPPPQSQKPFVGVRRTPYFPPPSHGVRGSKPRPPGPWNQQPTTPVPKQPQKSLVGCRPGQRCQVHLKSFETASEVLQYAYSHSSALPPVVQAILDDTQSGRLPPPLKWSETISPEVVQYTMNLMRAVRPNRALIVGVFTGLSVVGAATAINNRGLVIGVEYPQFLTYWKQIGNKYAQQADLMTKIQLRTEFPIPDTLDQLAKQEPGSFDFILLDDSAQENYKLDYEKCLRLLRSGGILLINDFLVGGEVLSGPSMQSRESKAVAQMNQKIQGDTRVDSSFIPIGGGLIMVYKK